ncbi:MAG: nodulation protein NfeD [Candidatus Aminicenantes bacterium]|nr:nodulation protein NfeD [Candidatus Aminicenantes bacterium]
MKRIAAFGLAGILAGPLFGQAAVLKIKVEAAIHPVTSEYIRGAIERADREMAALLLIGLDTPGGLDTSMREIIAAVLAAKTPVAAYVSPSGGRAASAGFFIGLACDIFAMAPGTSTGAAHPVGVSVTGQPMDKTMEDKVTEDAASYIRSLAEKRGRNLQMAEDAVRKSRSYSAQEALAGGLIDLVAADDGGLLGSLDGRTLRRWSGEESVLRLAGREIIEIPMTARQKFLLTISNPNLAAILLLIGLLGLYFEFANPGAILPGVLGGISLLLAIFSFQILPINYVGLILILLAAAMFILELKVHSFGALTIGGVAALVIGTTMLVKAPIPEMRPHLRIIVPFALGIGIIIAFLVSLVVRAHRGRVATGAEGLVGETGTAQTDLAPGGRVFVHGEIWRAVADEEVPRGARIKVTAVLPNLRLKVTKSNDG